MKVLIIYLLLLLQSDSLLAQYVEFALPESQAKRGPLQNLPATMLSVMNCCCVVPGKILQRIYGLLKILPEVLIYPKLENTGCIATIKLKPHRHQAQKLVIDHDDAGARKKLMI